MYVRRRTDPERRVPRPFDLNAYGFNPKTEYRDVG